MPEEEPEARVRAEESERFFLKGERPCPSGLVSQQLLAEGAPATPPSFV